MDNTEEDDDGEPPPGDIAAVTRQLIALSLPVRKHLEKAYPELELEARTIDCSNQTIGLTKISSNGKEIGYFKVISSNNRYSGFTKLTLPNNNINIFMELMRDRVSEEYYWQRTSSYDYTKFPYKLDCE